MPSIKIKFKDGSVMDFPHKGRPGGSYTKTIRYEGVFAIVKDEYGTETSFPSDRIAEITSIPERY